MEKGKPEYMYLKKKPWSKGKNQQQTQPTYGIKGEVSWGFWYLLLKMMK